MNKKLIGAIAVVIIIALGVALFIQGNRQQQAESVTLGNDTILGYDNADGDPVVTDDSSKEPESSSKNSDYIIMRAKQTIDKSNLDENELEVLKIIEAYFNIPEGMTVEEFATRALITGKQAPDEADIPEASLYYNDYRIEGFPPFGERNIELVHFRFVKYFDDPEDKRFGSSVIIPVQVQFWQDGELHKIELNPYYVNRTDRKHIWLTHGGFTKNDFYKLERLPENQVIFERD